MLKRCLSHLRALADLLARKPAPRLLVALYLSVRWRCLVSPSTDIHYPFSIVMGRGTMIPGRCTLIASGGGIVIGKGVEIHEGAYLHCQGGRITVGDRTAIGPYVVVYGGGQVRIGSDCGIAAHTTIVSTGHVFARTDTPIRSQGDEKQPVTIGDDVWIGTHCSIPMGVAIGNGSVLGAGTVLLKSVEPFSVVVGAPGRVIRKR